MSIASEITRITQLRNRIRTKLIALGEIDNPNADLFYCTVAIELMTPRGRFVYDIQQDRSRIEELSHNCTFNIDVDSLDNVKFINLYSGATYLLHPANAVVQCTTAGYGLEGSSGTMGFTMTYFDSNEEMSYGNNMQLYYSISTSGATNQITFSSSNMYFRVGGDMYLQYGYIIPGDFEENNNDQRD